MHIVHALFTPSLGGLEQAFVNITRILAQKGHKVTVLMREDAPYRGEIEGLAHGVSFVQPRGFYDICALLRIRRKLKALKPDMIVAHAPRAISLMGYAARGLGIPVCGMMHSYRASRVMRADRLVVLTEDMRKFVVGESYPQERVSIVSNSIILPKVAPEPAVLHAPLVIGNIGRLVPEKGLKHLVEAIGILHGKGIAVRLILAGTGQEEERLRQQVQGLGLEQVVAFAGWAGDKDAFFSSIDVFCLPSLEESFGIVLLEAMVRGVPVIASNAPGPSEIISAGRDGLLVPRGDARAIADAIEALLRRPELAQKLAEGAWKRVQDFSADNVAKAWSVIVELTLSTGIAHRKD